MPWTWNGRACGRRAVLGRVDQSGLLPSFPQRDLAHNPHNPQKSRVPAFLRIVRFLRTGSGLLVAIRRGNPVSMGRLGRSRGPREHGGFPGLLRIVREERRPGVLRPALNWSTGHVGRCGQAGGCGCQVFPPQARRPAATAGPPPNVFEETSRTIRTIRRNRVPPHFCVLCDFCGQGHGSRWRSVGAILAVWVDPVGHGSRRNTGLPAFLRIVRIVREGVTTRDSVAGPGPGPGPASCRQLVDGSGSTLQTGLAVWSLTACRSPTA
jgi:hypothetical protein